MVHRTLPGLAAGQRAIIDRLSLATGSAKRLADMGFVHGALVEMVRPGRPCIVQIEGIKVGIGRLLQDNILLADSA